ncbi:probable mitochondrial glutathione transporter SLC25A40 [Toxorhynchites rutilus septentrionalis]|uniref:probable mitochondrial glutathione transporter SLC25A40 n=1 Tax=Toxorhynchites rutilus septentrionalis TaxID=329112 RepID=UPI002478682B|nr:probable mitochondrial glutathione transporter SLC25A40 [Toxorhynchites rutilus septentrionalis]
MANAEGSRSDAAVAPSVDMDDGRFRIRPYQQILSSCSGALVTSLFMTPLDVVKTRLQTQQKMMLSNKCYLYCNGLMDHLCPCGPNGTVTAFSKPTLHFNGTVDAFVKISRSEGIKSLWSGLSPTLVLALPTTVIYFVAYEQFRIRLKEIYLRRNGTGTDLPMWLPMLAGGSARVLAVTIVNPLELIRTKMQSESLSYTEVGRAFKGMLKTQGILGLWKGFFPTILRDVPFSGIYWTTYETIKKRSNVTQPTFGFSFVSGAISGGVAAFVTVPFDVVKTHQQIEFGERFLYAENGDKKTPPKSAGTFETMRKIYVRSGIKGLFAGLTPRLIKVAPACAIMIASFEYGKNFFYNYNVHRYLAKRDKQDQNPVASVVKVKKPSSVGY